MESIIKIVVSFGGAAVTYAFGGWSKALGVLLTLIIIDYITGVIASWKDGELNSKIGMLGISKKIYIFFMVAVAHMADVSLGDAHFLRDAAIFFYISNELLSITENGGRMGVPIPSFITNAVKVLKEKSDLK